VLLDSVGLFRDLQRYITPFGIRVCLRTLDIEKPGEFDGLSITINPNYDRESACYYLAHSFGSIVQWSTRFDESRQVFGEIRRATRSRDSDPARLTTAIAAYRRFEETSSEHAVWMLSDAGHASAITPYTVFFRADIEAMTIFHRTGTAPRWRDFYLQWKERARSGDVWVEPFAPKPFGFFAPRKIDTQEVLQERD
jgi:hypothetical protein